MRAPRSGDSECSVVLLAPASLNDRFERIEGNGLAEYFEAKRADRATNDVEGTSIDGTLTPFPEVAARQEKRDGAPRLIEVDESVVVERLQVTEHRSGSPLLEDEGDSLPRKETNGGCDAFRRRSDFVRTCEYGHDPVSLALWRKCPTYIITHFAK